jgi:hypothetical protein
MMSLSAWAEDEDVASRVKQLSEAAQAGRQGTVSMGMPSPGSGIGLEVSSAFLGESMMGWVSAATSHGDHASFSQVTPVMARVMNSWVRKQAIPLLEQAKRDISEQLQVLETNIEDNGVFLQELGSAADAGWRGRALLQTGVPNSTTIAVAQVMSVLSNLQTLEVRIGQA